MKDIILRKQSYKLFPYEEQLALKEAKSLLGFSELIDCGIYFKAKDCLYPTNAKNLTFFSTYRIGNTWFKTKQFLRENNTIKRQNTRYYAHGIHEYKGKFNPQIVRALLNIYGLKEGYNVLDPFCGSGTSLFECQLQGISSVGVDINPMATFIAKVKTSILSEVEVITKFDIQQFIDKCMVYAANFSDSNDERADYLHKWFKDEYYVIFESIKRVSEKEESEILRNLILLTTSNFLRDYSCQEPRDLRIRRRISPYPQESIFFRLERDFLSIQAKIKKMSKEDMNIIPFTDIFNQSIIAFSNNNTYKDYFDFAITSPPYATALPYIDTQRLSIVWLDMALAKDIKRLECSLIGSRDIATKKEHSLIENNFMYNRNGLTDETYNFCMDLQRKLIENDGFRKRNVPLLLYKYFSEMREMFSSVYSLLKRDSYYCLIVGYNKTKIGGETLIDTPYYLSKEAARTGFTVQEILPLETYHRYELHNKNSITSEALIVLKK